jgi:putative ABC transport system permease protein
MKHLRLAIRNLLRAPRRSLVTMSAVIAGVGVFIVGDGFVSGLTENILVSAIDDTVGHVLARPAGYPLQAGRHPVDKLLELTPAARSLLEHQTVAFTERQYFAPLAAAGADSLRAMAIGYDPVRDPKVFPRKHWVIRGQMPAPDRAQVAVSVRVARLLNLSPGGQLVLQVRTHRGAMNALEVEVSAVVTTHNAALDLFGIFVPAALAHQLIASDLPSHISARLRDRDDAPAFAAKLAKALGAQAEVVTFRDETAELVNLQEIRRRALDLIMFILMALAAFGIANTILMAAYERMREIGTLRTLGMTELGVLRLFVLEGALLGALGGVLGAAWGGALTAYWAQSPIDFSEMFERAGNNVSTRFSLPVVVATMAVGVLVAVLASLYPARVAARMPPAEAVRAT